MFTKILVPSDGSTLSLNAAAYAADLAKKHSASVVGLYLIDSPTFIGLDDISASCIDSYKTKAQDNAKSVLNAVCQLCADRGVPFSGYTHECQTLEVAVTNAVNTQGCDLVIFGYSRFDRLDNLMRIWLMWKLSFVSDVPVLFIKFDKY